MNYDEVAKSVEQAAHGSPDPQQKVELLATSLVDTLKSVEVISELESRRLACWLWMNTDQAWCFIDKTGKVCVANTSFSRLSGWSTLELQDMPVQQLLGPEGPAIPQVVEELFSQRTFEYVTTIPIFCRRGKRVPCELRLIAPRGSDWALIEARPVEVIDFMNMPEEKIQILMQFWTGKMLWRYWKQVILAFLTTGGLFNIDRLLSLVS
jgi:PAS domain S-box-containing protein